MFLRLNIMSLGPPETLDLVAETLIVAPAQGLGFGVNQNQRFWDKSSASGTKSSVSETKTSVSDTKSSVSGAPRDTRSGLRNTDFGSSSGFRLWG